MAINDHIGQLFRCEKPWTTHDPATGLVPMEGKQCLFLGVERGEFVWRSLAGYEFRLSEYISVRLFPELHRELAKVPPQSRGGSVESSMKLVDVYDGAGDFL